MPGFDNKIVFASNVDFTGNSLTQGTPQISANGQLLIGSAAGPNGPCLLAGSLTSSDGSITVTNGSGTISLIVTGGSSVGKTITGDSGGPLVPSAGNWNLLGSGSLTTQGSGNTLNFVLTGLTNHAVLVGAGTTTITKIAATANTGAVLQNNSGADPSYSTATYPSVGTSTGSILRANGTNWLASTSTYPDTNAVSTLLYASSANVMSALATANSGVLSTSSSGVPSIDTTNFHVLSTGVQLKGNNTNTAPPAGFIGEYISAFVSHNSPVNITPSGTTVNVTSISLTAGVWNISFAGTFNMSGASQVVMGISATSATLPGNAAQPDQQIGAGGTLFTGLGVSLPDYRVTLSATTTYYLVAFAAFTTSTTAEGRISATRVG